MNVRATVEVGPTAKCRPHGVIRRMCVVVRTRDTRHCTTVGHNHAGKIEKVAKNLIVEHIVGATRHTVDSVVLNDSMVVDRQREKL